MTAAQVLSNPKYGLAAVVVAVVLYALGRMPMLRTVLLFFGILAVGLSGPVVRFTAGVLSFGLGLVGGTAGGFLGVASGTVVFVFWVGLVVLLAHDWHPKTGKPGKRTFWLAGLLAVAIVAGLTPWASLNNLPQTLQQGVSQAQGR